MQLQVPASSGIFANWTWITYSPKYMIPQIIMYTSLRLIAKIFIEEEYVHGIDRNPSYMLTLSFNVSLRIMYWKAI